MIRYYTFLLALFALPLTAQSNADKARALELGREAIKLMDDGQINESLVKLAEATALDPENPVYPYETGYAYYLAKDYKTAIKVLKKAAKKPNASKEMFSLIGNSYDYLGNSKKAIKTYEQGIERFPNTAIFHVELGILEFRRQDFTRAAAYWERGIAVDPNYPSNYFHLANLFSQTKEHIWTVLYGEAFLNLEPGTPRTETVSEAVYGAYRDAISLEGDSARVNFAKQMNMTVEELLAGKMPAPMMFGTTMALATVLGEDDVNCTTLHLIRSGFLDNWYGQGHDETYPNAVISRMKAIADAGHLEAYNHWLVRAGDTVGWEFWYDSHKEEFTAFAEWFNANGMDIRPGFYLTRGTF